MVKLLLILLVGLVFESTGVVLLKKGITQIGEIKNPGLAEIVQIVKAGCQSKLILLGVLFEAVFFLSLVILMSKSDISFLWPMTGLSFVFATFAAMWFLGEQVSAVRWAGVVLIMLGAALISYSDYAKVERQPPANLNPKSPVHQ